MSVQQHSKHTIPHSFHILLLPLHHLIVLLLHPYIVLYYAIILLCISFSDLNKVLILFWINILFWKHSSSTQIKGENELGVIVLPIQKLSGFGMEKPILFSHHCYSTLFGVILCCIKWFLYKLNSIIYFKHKLTFKKR